MAVVVDVDATIGARRMEMSSRRMAPWIWTKWNVALVVAPCAMLSRRIYGGDTPYILDALPGKNDRSNTATRVSICVTGPGVKLKFGCT